MAHDDNPLLLEAIEGTLGVVCHPNRGITRISSSEVENLLPFILGAVLRNPDTIGIECLQGRRRTQLRHSVSGPSRSHGIISFFDGSGSFADTLAAEIGPPTALLIAELDPDIRAVISAVHGYHQDPKVWVKARNKTPVRYLADVWEVAHQHFAALREFLALLPEDALIFGAGSPCQDNTRIGRGGGKLGITGTRSVHYHVVYIVMYAFQELGVAPLCLKIRQYVQDTSGAPNSCIHRINTATWSAVSRNRYFFVSNTSFVLPSRQADPWQHGRMLPKPRHKPATPPMPPWLRTRGTTPCGHIRFTTSACHPQHLLFHIAYFGSVEAFHEQCGESRGLNFSHLLPSGLFRLSFSGVLQSRSSQTKSKKLPLLFLPTISTTRALRFPSGFPCLPKR